MNTNTNMNDINIGNTARARRMRLADIRCELCNQFLTHLRIPRGRNHRVDWETRRTCIRHYRAWLATKPKCDVCGATVASGRFKMGVHSADHTNAFKRGHPYNFCKSCKDAGRRCYRLL